MRWTPASCGIALLVSSLACGIGEVGTGSFTASDDAGPSVEAPDAQPTLHAGAAVIPVCNIIQIDDPLTTFDTTRWQVVKDGSNGDHPKIVTGGESPLPGAITSLVTVGATGSRGGLWLVAPVPTREIDVKISFYVKCGGSCGDGLAVVWMNTANRKLLDLAASGRGFGIPPSAPGGGVVLDLFSNGESADPPTPNLTVLKIDGVGNPGDYHWDSASSPQTMTLLDALHTLEIRVRASTVEAKVDGAQVVTGGTTSGFESGLFGITAATGGGTATFLVRDFTARFADCSP